jgi:uncharacterized membrane protein
MYIFIRYKTKGLKMNIFYRNIGIAAVISMIPTILRQTSILAGVVGCLLLITSIIFMYKLYADAEQNKANLTLGQGAKFGALVGVLIGVLSLLFMLADMEGVRDAAIASIEPMRELMGEEAYDTAVMEIQNQSDGALILNQAIGIAGSAAISAIIGLIAGAIFKHDIDPDADLLNEIEN